MAEHLTRIPFPFLLSLADSAGRRGNVHEKKPNPPGQRAQSGSILRTKIYSGHFQYRDWPPGIDLEPRP